MPDIRLTREQQAVVSRRGNALLVSAAAGSGKTRVLVERLLDRVAGEEQRDIDEFLIITYTRAAAAELRSRIGREVSRRLAEEPGSAHLRRQALLVYRAQISTVHAFCASLLREHAHLLDLSPDFRILDPEDARLLLEQALDDVLEEQYARIGEDSDFRALVDSVGAGRDDRRLLPVVQEAYRDVRNHVDPEGWMAARTGDAAASARAAEALLLRDFADICAHGLRVTEEALAAMAEDEKLLAAYGPGFKADREFLIRALTAAGEGWDAVRAVLPFRAEKLKAAKGELKDRLKSGRDRLKKTLEKAGAWFDASQAENEQDEAKLLPVVRGLFQLTQALDRRYGELKTRRRCLDYGDLEHLALRLLLENGAPTETAARIAERYREVLVDEYQDTNRVQNAIFDAVSRNGENLFLVGDVKQSIYRFNLADPGIFLEKYRAFRPWEEAGEGPEKVLLSANFRSRPEIADCVNHLFSRLMSEELGEMTYGPDEALRAEGAFPEARDMEPELDIIQTDLFAPDGERLKREEGEAAAVARRIRDLIDSGFCVTGDDGLLRPVRPEDVVILMRSPGTRAGVYARALEQVGLGSATDGGEGLLTTVEGSVMLSYLEILDNPHQDVHLIGVLRSPLWSIPPDTLARIRAAAPKSDFYDALCRLAPEDERLTAFLTSLRALRFQASDMSPTGILRRLMDETDALAVFSAMRGGARRRANLTMLYRHAVRLEARGYTTLFPFLNALRRLQAQGKDLEAAPLGGSGSVRIMSIHKAKGLEFPVVVLADLTKQFNRDDLRRPVLIHTDLGVSARIRDEERGLEYLPASYRAIQRRMESEQLSEEMRILYVAMTRPKDKLILSAAMADVPRKLKNLAAQVSLPLAPAALREAGSLGDWVLLTALSRPEGRALRELAETDCPVEAVGGRLVVRIPGGAMPMPAPEETTPVQEAERAPAVTFEPYIYPHAAAVDVPSKVTATELRQEEAGEGPRMHHFARPAFLKRDRALTGAERGTAIHLAMQYIDYNACTDLDGVCRELRRLTEMQYLTEEQRDAVEPQKLLNFFRGEVGRLVREADKVRREFKFSLLVDAALMRPEAAGDRVLLQGVIDCWLEKGGRLTVIDFKSDAVTEATQRTRAESYRAQIGAYAAALEQMTGMPVERRILYFFATDSWEEI